MYTCTVPKRTNRDQIIALNFLHLLSVISALAKQDIFRNDDKRETRYVQICPSRYLPSDCWSADLFPVRARGEIYSLQARYSWKLRRLTLMYVRHHTLVWLSGGLGAPHPVSIYIESPPFYLNTSILTLVPDVRGLDFSYLGEE